jgi:tetratricopeptide (TPR) repeat protein
MRRKALAVALAVFALVAASVAASPAASPVLQELFQAGVKAYDAQDYDGAAARFEELLRYRVEHPAVEYNLGNAHFKRRDYGRAVLHWERALRLDPADGEARANLALVRTMLVDDASAPETPLHAFLERASRFVDRDETTLVAFAAWQLLGLAVLVAILRAGAARRVALGLAAIATLALVVVAPLLYLQVRDHAERGRLVVLTPAVEARSGPGEQYTSVFTVHEGLVVRSRGTASGYEWIELPNGLQGWVPVASVDRI